MGRAAAGHHLFSTQAPAVANRPRATSAICSTSTSPAGRHWRTETPRFWGFASGAKASGGRANYRGLRRCHASPSMSLGTGFGSIRAWSVASPAGMDAGA